MPDISKADDAPFYHANIVLSNINVDEMTMELRWFVPSRADFQDPDPKRVVIDVPAPSPETILATPVVARVSLTFSAVRALKNYLDEALPKVEQQRKVG